MFLEPQDSEIAVGADYLNTMQMSGHSTDESSAAA